MKQKINIDISIIFVNWNTVRLLLQAVQSVLNTIKDLKAEIIIVDNSSTDDSNNIIRSHFTQVKLINCANNIGFARAANIALAEASGNYFLIAHPDIEFQPRAIYEMFLFLKAHPEVGIVGGNLIYPDGTYNHCYITGRSIRLELIEFGFPINNIDEMITKLYKLFGKVRLSLYWNHESLSESNTIWNACMMFRRELLESVYKFDEAFFVWFADTDFCFRAKKAGWKMYLLPQAKVIHYEIQSGSYLENNQTLYKTNSIIVADAMSKDQGLLIRLHYGFFHLLLNRIIRRAAISKVKTRLLFLRVMRH